MAKDILMPLLSPSMTEGTLVRWLKKEGDAVKSGDVLAEVETDKATMDLEAFDTGILRKILAGEGEKVPINARIGIIGTKDEKIDESAPAPAAERPPKRPRPRRSRQGGEAEPPKAARQAPHPPEAVAMASAAKRASALAGQGGRIKASPLARKKSPNEKHVDLAAPLRHRPRRTHRQERRAQRPGQRLAPPRRRRLHLSARPRRAGRPPEAFHHALGHRQAPAREQDDDSPFLSRDRGRREADARAARAAQRAARQAQPAGQALLNDFVLKAAAEAVRRVPAVNAVVRRRRHQAVPERASSPSRSPSPRGSSRPSCARRRTSRSSRSAARPRHSRPRPRPASSSPRNSRAAPSPSPISACSASTASARSSIRRRSPSSPSATSSRSRSSDANDNIVVGQPPELHALLRPPRRRRRGRRRLPQGTPRADREAGAVAALAV